VFVAVVAVWLLAASGAKAARAPVRDVAVSGGLGGRAAEALAAYLGPHRTAGTYLDDSGRMTIAVTDDDAARAVRAAGAIPRHVRFSSADLAAVTTALESAAPIPNTSWGVDTLADAVVVSVGATSEADVARLETLTRSFGAAARIERSHEVIKLAIRGGNYIIGSNFGQECSLGFNVRSKVDNSIKYFVTAGHCLAPMYPGDYWQDANWQWLGQNGNSWVFPGYDYGVVKYTNPAVSTPGTIWLHNGGGTQDITHSRDSYVNEAIAKSGWKTGVTYGKVLRKDVTITTDDGYRIGNLDETDACADRGDSGGPMFHGDAALGIQSAVTTGAGGCISYFQRINPALSKYGVEVY
jgi:hypothetical protein